MGMVVYSAVVTMQVNSIADELEQKNKQYEWLSEITDYLVYGTKYVEPEDPDWECRKWIDLVELAKQDYPNFVEETLNMAEKKCGFDVNDLIKQK